MNATSHIFIVGVHRSGTALMRHLLNDSTQIGLCDETHYMGHLLPDACMRRRFRDFAPLTDDVNVRRLVEYMYSERFMRYSRFKELGWQWQWIVETFPAAEVERRLLACDRSEPGVFDTFMKLVADHHGATVRGEKTPIHLRWVETLLEWYPDARVIHMIRDPRAVYVSDVKRRLEQQQRAPVYEVLRRFGPLFKPFMVLETVVLWRESARRARRTEARHPGRCLTVRFEDLVGDPAVYVPGLCARLGVEFQPSMLDRTVVSEGFKAGEKGFDVGATERWRRHIAPWAERALRRCLGREMRHFGYH